MKLTLGLGIGMRLQQALRLTCAQRIALDMAQLQRRRDLVEAVHGETFRPKAACPACHHSLTDYEIMKGFKDDPRDYTTECPKCRRRFAPRLFHSIPGGSVEVAFCCPQQTLALLPDLATVPLDDFRTKHADIYNSAIVHFGGLKQAFGKIGLVYRHEAELDWRRRVDSFLGKLPDTVIAGLVGASRASVRRLRVERGIAAYRRREEVEGLS